MAPPAPVISATLPVLPARLMPPTAYPVTPAMAGIIGTAINLATSDTTTQIITPIVHNALQDA
jgi:hypothetical protein